MLKGRIDQDLKTALLAGDTHLVTTLRGLKSVILYAEVAKGVRDTGLADEEIEALLNKEAKKRQESADLYIQGGSEDRAQQELKEKSIIEKYLPKQLSDEELRSIVEESVLATDAQDAKAMGQIIGIVKQKVGTQADGARIARFVKERMELGK